MRVTAPESRQLDLDSPLSIAAGRVLIFPNVIDARDSPWSKESVGQRVFFLFGINSEASPKRQWLYGKRFLDDFRDGAINRWAGGGVMLYKRDSARRTCFGAPSSDIYSLAIEMLGDPRLVHLLT